MKKTIVLTIISLFLLLFFFLLPKNHEWFNERIISYWNDFRIQKNRLDIEQRKIKRWGNSYILSKQIAELVARNRNLRNAILLIPPSAYFKDKKINYHVPEPAVFYYYTGVKTTWINSNEALKANWIVYADSGHLKIIPVTDKNILSDSINAFKKYPVSL